MLYCDRDIISKTSHSTIITRDKEEEIEIDWESEYSDNDGIVDFGD